MSGPGGAVRSQSTGLSSISSFSKIVLIGLREFANGWVQTTDALRASLCAACLVFFWIIFQNMKKYLNRKNSFTQYLPPLVFIGPLCSGFFTSVIWLMRGYIGQGFPSIQGKKIKEPHLSSNLKVTLNILIQEDKPLILVPARKRNCWTTGILCSLILEASIIPCHRGKQDFT